jgi:uncharacterized protein
MNIDEPIIIKFKSKKGNNYIYDPCSNLIFFGSDILIDVISLYKKTNKDILIKKLSSNYEIGNILQTYKFVRNLVEKYSCFFPEQKETKIRELNKDTFEREIANLSILTLEVTQRCNFRCKYCSYSGKYYYQRTHSNNSMNFRVAKKIIDYFLTLVSSDKRTTTNKNIVVSFYGGEPLLEFGLIRKCVEYLRSKTKYLSINISFGITTNGSLLNSNVIEYLVKNTFSLAISLDGPEEIHNKNRVYRNGKGTFNNIWKNIKKIKKSYPSYYSNCINYLITISPDYDLERIEFFFRNKSYFNRNNLTVNPVNAFDNAFIKHIQPNPDYNKNYIFLHGKFQNHLAKYSKSLSPFLYGLFSNQYKKSNNLFFQSMREKSIYTGTCIPGGNKMYVDTNGILHACERINQNFPIGDYLNGYDFNKVKKMWASYCEQITENCPQCFAKYFCDICYANTAKHNCFKRCKECEITKNNFMTFLHNYISLLEENPRALDWINHEE